MPLLMMLLRRELAAIPVEHWGYFFPGHVAVWRFLEQVRPGLLGTLQAGYRGRPYFRGRGSDWFTNVLGERADYLDALESIFYPLADELAPVLPDRDSFREQELPAIDEKKVEALASSVLRAADEALAGGGTA